MRFLCDSFIMSLAFRTTVELPSFFGCMLWFSFSTVSLQASHGAQDGRAEIPCDVYDLSEHLQDSLRSALGTQHGRTVKKPNG